MGSERRFSSLGGVVELDDRNCVDAMVTINDVPLSNVSNIWILKEGHATAQLLLVN